MFGFMEVPINSKHKLYGIIIFLVTILACSFGGEIAPEPTTLPPGDGPTQPTDLETATVAHVVDGDTIELTDGRRVRYIGINTPERDQPYYQEATEANRQLVDGKDVQLECDQETFDKYGRTLAYIWVEGQMVNLTMLRDGFANA
jgi:micrococcal nuclease